MSPTSIYPLAAPPHLRRYFSFLNGSNYYRQALGGGLLDLLALSSDCNEPAGTGAASAQAAWLAAQLAAPAAATWRFVLLHHSPYSSASSHGSITRLQWGFEGMGLDAAFSGHDHVSGRGGGAQQGGAASARCLPAATLCCRGTAAAGARRQRCSFFHEHA